MELVSGWGKRASNAQGEPKSDFVTAEVYTTSEGLLDEQQIH